MSVIPCQSNRELRAKIEAFVEILKTDAHKLGDLGLSEREFYDSGLFRGSVERIRGYNVREKEDRGLFATGSLPVRPIGMGG